MKIYTIEVTTKNKREFIVIPAENELDAMDKIVDHYENNLKEKIIDIKEV